MKREATADDLGLHERASATPARRDASSAPLHGHAPAWASQKLTLCRQQEWFSAIVTTPESQPTPVDAESARRLVTPSATLSALERLDIYRRGYHARLIECLIDDYPVLQYALGEDAFETLCRSYIERHPSASPSLNFFGRHMSDFCRAASLENPGFAADLAALEWTIVLAIHARTAAPLTAGDLARVPAERWPEARLVPNPSLRILHLDYPANGYLQSFRQGKSPAIPAAQSIAVAVYRTGRSVWRAELSPPRVALFESLAKGVPLGEALAGVEPLLGDKTEAEAATLLTTWFREGVSSGLFSDVLID